MSKNKFRPIAPQAAPVPEAQAEQVASIEEIEPEINVPETQTPETQEAGFPAEARVLVDVMVNGVLVRSGSLLVVDAEAIASLGDQVDAHPDAVAYCKSRE